MASGRIRLGGWLSMTEPLIVEAAGRAGFDWVGLDLQHGAWDLGAASRGIQLLDLLNVPVLVRVAEDELHIIPHVLDQGASGIVVAMTSGPASVTEAISRARYHPEGRRSYGGQRYGLRPDPADLSTLRPAIYAMVETREGIRRLEEIAAVRSLAGIHVGPVDLCLDLGLDGDRTHPVFSAALRKVVSASRAAEMPAVMHAVSADQVSPTLEFGFDELVLTADIGLVRAAFAQEIARARSAARELARV